MLGWDVLFGGFESGASVYGVKLRMRSSEAFDADETLFQEVSV